MTAPNPSQEQHPPPAQSQNLFPTSFHLYTKAGLLHEKFSLGTTPDQPLYECQLKTDALRRPEMTLRLPGTDKHAPGLASIKSKGLKDSLMTIEPTPGSGGTQLVEKLTVHYGASSRTYTFSVAVPGHGVGKREVFRWTRPGNAAPAAGGAKKKSRLDEWGLGMDSLMSLDGGMGSSSGGSGLGDSLSMDLDNKRELRREGSDEVLAVWMENQGTSMSKVGTFQFVNAGAAGAFGPQWEIMAVMSVLRIWHEDYNTAKQVMKAIGGG